MITLTLPYPPSVNTYWRKWNNRMVLSPKGRDYKLKVKYEIAQNPIKTLYGRLSLSAYIYPPDNRRRDLDNVLKGILDALGDGAVYQDDSQIDILHVERYSKIHEGCVVVDISEIKV
jgi:crossover junction endodeoxyribonuclease RusA